MTLSLRTVSKGAIKHRRKQPNHKLKLTAVLKKDPLATTQHGSPATFQSLPTEPTEEYLKLTEIPSRSISSSQPTRRKLLILDLNGTLLSRTKNRRGMYVRPYIDMFLTFIFDNFNVMVWSSAQQESVKNMVKLFSDSRMPSTVWNRSHLGLPPHRFRQKAPTVKDLARIWQSRKKDSAKTTILLDDSPSKSSLQPYNGVHIPTFDHNSPSFLAKGDRELIGVIDYLKLIKNQSNVSNFIRNAPYVAATVTTTSPSIPSPSPVPSLIESESTIQADVDIGKTTFLEMSIATDTTHCRPSVPSAAPPTSQYLDKLCKFYRFEEKCTEPILHDFSTGTLISEKDVKSTKQQDEHHS